MKAVILTRVSSKEQEDRLSLDAQNTRLIEYAKRKKLEVLKSFQIVESSTQGDRKKFKEVIDFCKKQKETIALLADAVDRVQRSFKESVMLDDLVRHGKIELHFLRENMIISKNANTINIMQWDFAVMGAKSYVLQLSENVKRSLEYKAKNGEITSSAPLGYENYRDEYGKGRVSPQPVYDPLVIRMIEIYSLSKISIKELQNFATQHNLLGRNGNPISTSNIHKMLKNPFYYGMMKWKGSLQPHIYPPLISQELWNKCQEIRTGIKAANKPYKYGEKQFLYRGLIRCVNSGKICSCDLKKGRFSYIICYDKQGHRKYIPEKDITDQIAYILHSIKIPEDMVAELHEHLKNSKESEIKYRDAELTQLKADLTRTLNRIDRLCNLYLDDGIAKKDYIEKNNELIAEKEKIKTLIAAHSEADDGFNDIICELVDIANNSWDIFLKSPNFEAKRNLLKFILRTLEIDEGKLGFSLAFPFNKLSNLGSHPLWSEIIASLRTQKQEILTLKHQINTIQILLN